MILPDVQTLRILHEAQLRRFGGAPGIRDAGRLEAAVGRVHSALGYREMDAVEAAALLAHAILRNHPFVDGNKRTAWGAVVMTLAANGLRLEAEDMAIADLVLSAAAGQEDHAAIAAWLRAHTTADRL
ncbi:MAG: type II toxin-antitoxin system death-on-curing family toxin [Alphaproteobacteria bacterium]|nr:type II toxin-antitoxin system death-on-curing family toxin [Alphaproteobacteria bacterium]